MLWIMITLTVLNAAAMLISRIEVLHRQKEVEQMVESCEQAKAYIWGLLSDATKASAGVSVHREPSEN